MNLWIVRPNPDPAGRNHIRTADPACLEAEFLAERDGVVWKAGLPRLAFHETNLSLALSGRFNSQSGSLRAISIRTARLDQR